ncbi:hypothetical protein MrNuV_ORF099 [Macrobrachium rosenbergii nudivirus]|nr:hypothetical protein MrNuV_ORF099 [Macrobrachium rosenbergii nudivirus]
MIHIRQTNSIFTTDPKSGYRLIELFGPRYVITFKNGDIVNVVQYSKNAKPIGMDDIENMKNFFETSYIQNFNGSVEIIYNALKLSIIDIIHDENSSIMNKSYTERLSYLENIFNRELLLAAVVTHGTNTNDIKVPTLFRSMDSCYRYGADVLIDPANKECVYALIGCARERKPKILVPEKPYDNIKQIPKYLKLKFEHEYVKAEKVEVLEEDYIKDVNNWKQEIFQGKEIMEDGINIINKKENRYIEIINPEYNEYYLVAARDVQKNKLQIFGKVLKSNKYLLDKQESDDYITDAAVIDDLNDSWVNYQAKKDLEAIFYYDTFKIIACSLPKISKSLSTLSVLNVLLDKPYNELNLETLDVLPKKNTVNTKNLTNISSLELMDELLNRCIYNKNLYEELKENMASIEQSTYLLETTTKKRTHSLSDDEEEMEDDGKITTLPARKVLKK